MYNVNVNLNSGEMIISKSQQRTFRLSMYSTLEQKLEMLRNVPKWAKQGRIKKGNVYKRLDCDYSFVVIKANDKTRTATIKRIAGNDPSPTISYEYIHIYYNLIWSNK